MDPVNSTSQYQSNNYPFMNTVASPGAKASEDILKALVNMMKDYISQGQSEILSNEEQWKMSIQTYNENEDAATKHYKQTKLNSIGDVAVGLCSGGLLGAGAFLSSGEEGNMWTQLARNSSVLAPLAKTPTDLVGACTAKGASRDERDARYYDDTRSYFSNQSQTTSKNMQTSLSLVSEIVSSLKDINKSLNAATALRA